MSLVHHFFPLNVQVPEKKILEEKLFLWLKLTQNYFEKHQICSHNIFMSHQRSIVHNFFPLNVQNPEKNFLRKSCSISEN